MEPLYCTFGGLKSLPFAGSIGRALYGKQEGTPSRRRQPRKLDKTGFFLSELDTRKF